MPTVCQDTSPPNASSQWEALLDSSTDKNDPLLLCLLFLTQFFDQPTSAQVIKAKLPAYEGSLTPGLLIRAAECIGLRAKVVKKKLSALSDLALPAIAVLADNEACVLIETNGENHFKIMLSSSGGGVQEIERETLKKTYTGYAILVRPEYQKSSYKAGFSEQKPRHWFWSLLYQDWWIYLQVVLAALLINTFALTTPLFIMTVYDRVIPNPNPSNDTLWVLAIGVATVFVFDALVRTLRGYFIDVAGRRVDVLLASRVFNQVIELELQARPISSGAFANTLRELESLRDVFTSATLISLVDFPFIFGFIAVFSLIGGPMTWILMIMVPVTFLMVFLLQVPLIRSVRGAYHYNEQKNAVLIETLTGLETIKAIGAGAKIRQQWEHNVTHNSLQAQRSRFWSLTVLNLVLFAQQMTLVAIVVYGVYLVQAGVLSFGMLLACVMLSGRTMAPIVQLAQTLVRMHYSVSAYKSLKKIMQLRVERPESKKLVHRPILEGEIEFRNVTFRYPGQVVNAVEKINFKITAGERVGIIGRVGSGKSTLHKLILRLFCPDDGIILIDGIDTRQLDPADLRSNIGYVSQDLFLFHGTVRDNITMGHPGALDADIINSVKLTGIDEFLGAHPLGYDLPVGERGEGLSGGQRQAIILARALLLNPPVLLLDEPTNAMDNRSEEHIRTSLTQAVANTTLVLVTHRTSLLTCVDRLLVLDNGCLVADGPKQQVLDALANGKVGVST